LTPIHYFELFLRYIKPHNMQPIWIAIFAIKF